MGEFNVATILSTLSRNDYHIFNNIIVPSKYGTTQIDHVVVSIYGIFVIETKNYKGLIYGGDNAETWTKNMWGNKYSFRNPLKQNYGHVSRCRRLLMFLKMYLFQLWFSQIEQIYQLILMSGL